VIDNLDHRIDTLNDSFDGLRVHTGYQSVPYCDLMRISVKIEAKTASGSGVVMSRIIDGKVINFVWTAGHVVEHVKTEAGFDKVQVIREIRVNGLLKREEKANARVIAYSDKYDEDLALLEIEEAGFFPKYFGFTFNVEPQYPGTPVVHVGATYGLYGSVTLGIVAQTDRELKGQRFDQTTCLCYPGSSGGGIFTYEGECIGLITRGVGPGLNFIVPARRIKAWAEREGIAWAFDRTIPVPLTRASTELERYGVTQ